MAQHHPQQTQRGLSWERSRLDRLVEQYTADRIVPGLNRPLDVELISRLCLCVSSEGYGREDVGAFEDNG